MNLFDTASITWAFCMGCFLGVRHATDADHVATIATIVRAQDGWRQAVRTAVLWGTGHTLTFMCVGFGIIVFKLQVAPWFEQSCELTVAALLIGLGAAPAFQWAVQRRMQRRADTQRPKVAQASPPWTRRGIRSVCAGLVHGLAGSAAVALLALTLIPTTTGAIVYLLCFGAGTVLGMCALTLCLIAPLQHSARQRPWVQTSMACAASCASVVLGALMAWDVLAS